MSLGVRVAAGVLACGAAPASAQQDWLSQANQFYKDIFPGADGTPGQRTDLGLLPAIAGMDLPPTGLTSDDSRLMHPDYPMGLWEAASAWAAAPGQQAVIAKLDELTDPALIDQMGWGQPYGVEALDASDDDLFLLIENGLYTEVDVGGMPLLAGADFKYLWGLERVHMLVNIEATRRAESGDVIGALDVLRDWLLVCNQVAQRRFETEMRQGLEWMLETCERMRDVAYVDFKSGSPRLAADVNDLREVVDTIGPQRTTEGHVRLARLQLPQGNEMAARQLAETVLQSSGANPVTFAPTMARLATEGNPLRLFSEIPRWEQVAQFQAPLSEARTAIQTSYGDMAQRWSFTNPFDPLLDRRYDIERFLSPRFTVVASTLGPVPHLFDLRRQVRLEVLGTRHALSMVGISYASGMLQRDADAAAGRRWVTAEEDDPYNPTGRDRGANPRLQYILPGVTTGSGSTHVMSIVVPGRRNFSRNFDNRDFILYSVGRDGAANGATRIQNTVELVVDSDYLIWPPVLSLIRQNEIDQGG